MPTQRQDSLAAQVRARIEAGSRDRFWRPQDFDGLADPLQVDRVLSRLGKLGLLRSVRRGLYWRGHPTRFGMAPPPSHAIVAAVAGKKGIGPAGLSAANQLGLTSQVPAVDIVAVPGRPPRPVGAVRFVDRSGRRARVTNHLNQTEVALLEVLDAWDRVVELDAPVACRHLTELVQSGSVRADRLAMAAIDEPAAARERLRTILTAAGSPELAGKVPPARSATRAGLVATR